MSHSRSLALYVVSLSTAASFAAISVPAKAIEPYIEYRKQVEKAESIDALKPDLMGEQVSNYDGSTRFEVTDIELPGNNALPVRLTRSLSIELRVFSAGSPGFDSSLGGIGDWTLEVPHIAGSFDSSYQWTGHSAPGGTVTGITDKRCSQRIWPEVNNAFLFNDVWQGNTISVPGQGGRVMLMSDPENPPALGGTGQNWTSKEHDRFSCIPMKSGLTGEGFLMTDKNGVKYYFDTAVSRTAAKLQSGSHTALRVRIYLLASRVEDRFGNYVSYAYNGNGQPVQIASNDGRVITLTYSNENLLAASTNGRTWSYQYGGASSNALAKVTLPDGQAWLYQPSGSLHVGAPIFDGSSSCVGEQIEANFGLTVTHPSGATGQFQFSNTRHFRSGVPSSYCVTRVANNEIQYQLQAPYYWDVMSLRTKLITGAGLPGYKWAYGYDNTAQPMWGGNFRNGPCTTCTQEKTTTILNPDGTKVLTRFGIVLAGNEARELGGSIVAADGKVMQTRSNGYLTDAEAAGQPFNDKWGHGPGSLFQNEAKVRPVISREMTQDGVSFRSSVNTGCVTAGKLCADSLARPTLEAGSNSLGYSRTQKTEYYDNETVWVLGQVSRTWTNNILVSETGYNASKAVPVTVKSFGKLEQTLTYNADGTVATVTDGNGHTTTLSGWNRGTPQSIRYADGRTQSAVVDANGWLNSVTDENGYTTGYAYDAMGRINTVTPPEGNATTYTLEKRSTAEHGLPGGHWLRRKTTGNHRTNTFLDAWWQPVLVHEFDGAAVETTLRAVKTTYDHEGRVTFTSYPANDRVPADVGVWTEYDALGRTTSVSQDSEHGLLTTLTEYLPGLKTRTTDPNRGYTTTSYQAFDTPTLDFPVLIEQPEGVTTEIKRDAFGKPLEITR